MIVEIILALLTVVLALIAWQYVKYKDFRHQLNQLPGPPPLFFLGNIREISQQGTALLGMLMHHAKLYEKEGLFRLWIGPNKVMVFCFRPELVEPLVTSSRHIKKSENYDYFDPWLGKGLLTSAGDKWRSRRKLLTPTFHFKILAGFHNVFNDHAKVLVSQLNKVADGRKTNIFNYVTMCTLDVICETAMGVHMDGQHDATSPYINDLITLADITMRRMFTFYLQPDVIFYSLPIGKRYQRCLKGLHDFTNKVIKEKSEEYIKMSNQLTKDEGQSLADSLEQEGEGARGGPRLLGSSKRLAFLDLLLYMRYAEQADVTDADIRNEVDTFMFEGHDTTASSISWTLYLIGCHPDVQERLQNELQEVFGYKIFVLD